MHLTSTVPHHCTNFEENWYRHFWENIPEGCIHAPKDRWTWLILTSPSRENQWWMIIILKSKQEMLYSIIFLTSLSDSTSTWSYSLKATKNMMDVTFSKQWIHFRRSDRCPPTSTILKLYDDFVKTLSLWSIMLLK